MKCPNCPFYESRTSYGFSTLRCGNEECEHYQKPIEMPEEYYRKAGYTNAYDQMPDHDCMVEVIDHDGNKFKTKAYLNVFGIMVFDASKSKGYDICWWKEVEE